MALLWVLAVLLVALGLYHLVQCFLARGGSAADRWKDRASHAGQAVVFAALGVAAATVALGARPNGDRSAQTASRDVLSLSGGPLLLGLLAAGVVIGGIAFAAMGVRRSFLKKVDLPGGRVGSAVTVLGVVGYVAKGGALAIVGALLVVAAVKADPERAGGTPPCTRCSACRSGRHWSLAQASASPRTGSTCSFAPATPSCEATYRT